jgi:hypothetical protein
VHAKAGRTEEALRYLAELEAWERDDLQLALHLDFSVSLAALGRIDEAVERVRAAIDTRIGAVVMVRHTFAWDGLRDDARVNEMLAGAGL